MGSRLVSGGTAERSGISVSARREAVHAVRAAVRAALQDIDASGGSRRTFGGLWQAAIGFVLITFEAHDVVLLLEDRAAGLKGHGFNADADLETVSPDSAPQRRSEIMAAGDVFSRRLQDAFVAAEGTPADEAFPEAVLDVAIEILVKEWGPHHVRRALAEQVTTLLAGEGAVADITEPLLSTSAAAKQISPHDGTGRPRTIVIRVESASPEGKPRWAYVLFSRTTDGLRRDEFREVRASAPGTSSSATLLAGIVDAMQTIAADGPGATVVVETSAASLIRGIQSPQTRPASESAMWRALDAACAGIHVEWRRLPQGAKNDELAVRCAKLLEHTSTGEAAVA